MGGSNIEIHNIGQVVKDLRKYYGISQKELAKGICTQAQISKIENNSELPSSLILYRLASKLGVDMNYFFSMSDTPRLDYINDVKRVIRDLIRKRDYREIDYIIKKEKNNPLFKEGENRQFMLWHEAICSHYVYKETSIAIDSLLKALWIINNKSVRGYYSEQEIEILNSLAILKKDQEQYDEAIKLFIESLTFIKLLPQVKNELLHIRLLYGISKVLTIIDKFEESKEYLDKAIQIFRIQHNTKFVKLVEEKKQKLLNL